ncbi:MULTISPECIES: EAL domain-containing protein [unclassified Thioalkalivibrio]|uniref:EAL domain-containing protein n=1 Tax=unclassified Thioalkalivibrio TaxID=2621013 RepID=UPI0003806618|nr:MULTISPECIES: EAL domain-containing protein [unclassified Thioalkalivibrio]
MIEHVLVVDDSTETTEEIIATLRRLGINGYVANDLTSANLILERTRIDLVLLDLRLGNGNGLDLLPRVAALPRLPPPVAFVSGLDPDILISAEDVARRARLPVAGHLAKPLGTQQLAELLDSVSQRPLPEHVEPPPMEPLSMDAMERALEHGWVVPFFQPQYDLVDGTLSGFEALARYFPPDRPEPVGPAAFAVYLDSERFAWRIFESMACQSLDLFERMNHGDPNTRLSINLPAEIFADPRFPGELIRWCRDRAFPHDRLVLELTETRLNLTPEQRMGLSKARISGFELSLDDFGSGASNLDRLAQLPFTEVKIDAWFLLHGEDEGRNHHLLGDIARLCRQRNIRTVVEGVGDSALLELAIRDGFNVGQGYLFGRPMSAEDASSLPLERDEIASLRTITINNGSSRASHDPVPSQDELALLNSLWDEASSPEQTGRIQSITSDCSDPTQPWCLIVEDDEVVREEIAITLKQEGQTCWMAESLEDCRWSLRNIESIGVIFLDLCLPDGNGLEVLEPILKAEYGQAPAVVVLTGRGSPEVKRFAERAGATLYLDKPASSIRIRQAFYAALAHYRTQLSA